MGQQHGSLNEFPSLTDIKYGRFDVSWTGTGSGDQLSSWLDPAATNASSMGATTRIQGNDILCPAGATYSIPDFRTPGNLVYTYTWTVSGNLTIISGQGTPNLVVAAKSTNPSSGAEAIIVVNTTRNGINVCSASKIVDAYGTANLGNITLSSPNCSNCTWNTAIQSVPGATSYEWQYYPALTTTVGPPIPMNVETNLCVRAIYSCGYSAWKCQKLTGPKTCGCFSGGSDDRDANHIIDLDETAAFDFQIAPNPTDDHSVISILLPEENATETYQVKVIDLLGKTIFERTGLAGGTQILGETKEMSAGMYSVQVCSNTGKTATRTLVVK